MRKLLLVASLAIVGTMSAKNGENDLKSTKDINQNEKLQKIEIKITKSQSVLKMIADVHCFDEIDGQLVEVKCPKVIIVTGN